MPLNAQQKAAVEYLEGPLLVLAGPGTGKTQLLSAKVAYILEHTDANPENILCLTFTDAGAENMRSRLQTMIGKAALDVNIHTYHAFGANLLERYKNYAETLDRKLDAPIDQTAQYKIVADIQKSLPATDILRNSSTKDIIDTISSAKSARLTAHDLQKIATQNTEDSHAISAEISPIFLNAPARMKFDQALAEVYQPVLEILAKYTSPEPISGNIERIANTMTRELNQIIETATTTDPGVTATGKPKQPSVQPLSAWKKKYIEIYDAGDRKHPETAYRLSDTIANKKLFSLAHIMEKYDQYLSANGLFDFDDMIEYAIHYLKTDRGFRLSLSELFQYVLLDEFQDTNPSQFELIKLLTDYEKPIIMAVGDDDQAIYEFQGANASNLMDFQQHYGAEVITLVDNYRSIGAVLEFSKHIADQITDSFAKNYEQVDKTLHSMQDEWNGAPKAPEIERHEFSCSEAEYYWIAEKIRSLVDAGEDPNEIAILAPKHKNIAPILPYLKAKNLDVTYEKRDNLLQDDKIRPLLTIARFIQELAEGKKPAHRLLEILSYDFWQIPASTVITAIENSRMANKPTLSYLSGDEKLESLADFFANLATISTTAPLELWLDYLTGAAPLNGFTSPFLSFYDAHSSAFEKLEFYENLATFRQTILAHAKSLDPNADLSAPKLKDLIATLDDYEAAEAEIMRISTYRDDNQAIQVMTAFKSKGLEFKHVFLTSVDDSAWGKAKGNNNLLALPKNLVSIRHTGVSDDEKLRVLFVAITRAKQSLYLTNARLAESGKEIHRLAYLEEESRESVAGISPYLPTAEKSIQLHDGDLSPEQRIETKRLGWIAAYQAIEPATIEPLLKARLENYRLTASDLTTFIDLTYAGPQALYQRKVLRAPDEPASRALCYGTLIHSVFEQVTSQKIDDAAALELFKSTVPRTALAPDEQQELLEQGTHDLAIALAEFSDILRHPNARAEANLSPEKLAFDGVPLTGKIDHINLDETTKTIEVYDFKTGNFRNGKWDSHPSLYKYRLQLAFYKLLLNLSPTYSKYTVTRGHILFVTPDADEKVHDKVYEYNDADDAELKSLIKAIYTQIKSLDFVKNPELFIPADKNNTMKQIRPFVDLLISMVAEQ